MTHSSRLRIHFSAWSCRTQQAPEAIANTVTRKLREIDPQVAVSNVASMSQIIHDSPTMVLRAYPAYLLAGFAATALTLAVLGIYGLLAYSVVQRQRELGLRLALGAAPSDLRQLVVANGLKLASSDPPWECRRFRGVTTHQQSLVWNQIDRCSDFRRSLPGACVRDAASHLRSCAPCDSC